MISSIYPCAVIKTPFAPKGISNIIQAVGDDEILYIKARDEIQLDTLLEKYLSNTFKGLIVSPFTPNQIKYPKLNYLVIEREEIDKEIEEKIEDFYPLKSPLPPVFGVTGTNGKTSTCWLFSELMKQAGKNVLYLGTMGTFLAGEKKEDKVLTTTPSYLELRKIYSNYDLVTDFIAIEVSSHALEQKRIGNLNLDVAAWTNFTQDHLDFHKTMDAYFHAKLKIKDIVKSDKVIVLEEEIEIRNALGKKAMICSDTDLPPDDNYLGQGFILKNLKLALSACRALGIELESVEYSKIKLPPGRFEVIENKDRIFIVDYAHTPDALDKLLQQIKDTFLNRNIYVIFGCGGDRDRTKRSLMGEVVDKSGFNIIVTSDNPRSEDPEQILNDVAQGIKRDHFKIEDRKEAIEKAYELSNANDVIVIAGKGHEDYQEIHGKRYHFSDQEIVRKIHD